MPPARTALVVSLALLALAPSGTPAAAAESRSAQSEGSALRNALVRAMRPAGARSGAYVVNVDRARVVLQWRHKEARILASNTKLFTTSAALARFGPAARLSTQVRGDGDLAPDGTYQGNLYLVGGGDPTFGSRRFGLRAYGPGASAVEYLAAGLKELGIERVTGRVLGDESRFDSIRGGPDSGHRTSIYVGPLSGLAYNRGLASESGRGFQLNPPAFAAAKLRSALLSRGVAVAGAGRAGRAPREARLLTFVSSPPMARLASLTNKSSDNFVAETLLKDLAMQANGKGTTTGGARIASAFAGRLGARARLADGSGLSRGNRASPFAVAKLLMALRDRKDEFPAFFGSLSIAGRDGTLGPRMRRGPARNRCRGKTGTISGVSALSGYCKARSGETYVFSILMNGVNPFGARKLQDRMLQAIAGQRGDIADPRDGPAAAG